MPKDNIERAIKRAQGGDAESYDEVRYEGYGPGGVAVIVEALTDNRNRTASEVRSTFARHGGSLGETNSVSFQFDRVGRDPLSAPRRPTPRPCWRPPSRPVRPTARAARRATRSSARRTSWPPCATRSRRASGRPSGPASAGGRRPRCRSRTSTPNSLFKLLEALDESDDVQRVMANFEVSDAALARLAG